MIEILRGVIMRSIIGGRKINGFLQSRYPQNMIGVAMVASSDTNQIHVRFTFNRKISKHDRWQYCEIGEFSLFCIKETNLSRGIPNRKFVDAQNGLWGSQKAIEGFQFLDGSTNNLRKREDSISVVA